MQLSLVPFPFTFIFPRCYLSHENISLLLTVKHRKILSEIIFYTLLITSVMHQVKVDNLNTIKILFIFFVKFIKMLKILIFLKFQLKNSFNVLNHNFICFQVGSSIYLHLYLYASIVRWKNLWCTVACKYKKKNNITFMSYLHWHKVKIRYVRNAVMIFFFFISTHTELL